MGSDIPKHVKFPQPAKRSKGGNKGGDSGSSGGGNGTTVGIGIALFMALPAVLVFGILAFLVHGYGWL